MTISDPVGDMFARIKNALQRNHPEVLVPSSKFKKMVLDAMEREGFILGYDVEKSQKADYENLKVNLKYVHGSSVINEINRVSKPGRRIYSRFDTLPRVQNGLGVAIISTSLGILTDNEAREKKVGGEIICNIS
jgi:small subunit ribosomal protein S8